MVAPYHIRTWLTFIRPMVCVQVHRSLRYFIGEFFYYISNRVFDTTQKSSCDHILIFPKVSPKAISDIDFILLYWFTQGQ